MSKYFSIVLSPHSQELLKSLGLKHPNVYCHHVTVAFNPSLEDITKWTPHIGKKISFYTTRMVTDEHAQAIEVNAPSNNEFPHVTMSTAVGVKPVYSNELLAKTEGVEVQKARLLLQGVLQYGN
jgi:hypothetical protein